MDLPSSFQVDGWNVRYWLTETTSPEARRQVKPVVFVHGTAWSSIVFKPVINALLANAKEAYRLLAYDLPGYGQSQSHADDSNTDFSSTEFAGDTSIKSQAKVLSELLKHVGLDGKDSNLAPTVIAHDIAGTIVLRTHLYYACNFESLILLDTNTVLPWGDGFYKLARTQPDPFVKLPPSIFEAVVRAVIQSAVYNSKVLHSGWEDLLAEPWLDRFAAGEHANSSQRQQSFVRQIAQANDKDVEEMLEDNKYASVRCPVKVIWGEEDAWIPRDKIEDMVKRMDGKVKECAFIPDAGHLVMLDQPERVAIEIFDWLSRYSTAHNVFTL